MLSTALGAGFICILSLEPRIARADCAPTTTPTTGETVTCTDTSTTAVSAQAGATNVTVNIMDGALLSITGSTAVTVGDSSIINLYGSASVSSTSEGLKLSGDAGTITLDDTSSVTTTGSGANAVRFENGSNTLVNNGTLSSNSAITVSGDNYGGYSDTIKNYGIISSGIGIAISLNDGNDALTLGTGSSISGLIDGGDATDSVTLVGSGTEDDTFQNFETLTIAGADWTLSGANYFREAYFNSGAFTNSGSLFITNGVIIGAGAGTLTNDGYLGGGGVAISGSSGDDTVANYGAVSGDGGTAISLNDGNDALTLGTGSGISGLIDGGDAIDSVTLVGSGTEDDDFLNFETLTMNGIDWILSGESSFSDVYFNSGDFTNSGALFVTNGVIIGAGAGTLTNDGYLGSGAVAITGSSGDDTVANYGSISGGGTAISLDDGNDALTLGTGSSIVGDIDGGAGTDSVTLVGSGSEDDDFLNFETLSVDQDCRSRLWARGFGQWGEEEASEGNQAFAYRTGGAAVGGDGEIGPGLRLGASLGTSVTEEEVAGDVSDASAEGMLATVYTTINKGRGFIGAAAGGGYQRFNLSRLASIGSSLATAEAETDGWVMQGSLQAGMQFELDGGMTVSPKASVAYVRQWIGSYSESGAGAGNVSIEDHDTGALRLKAQVEAGRSFELNGVRVDPQARIGIVSDLYDGGSAAGSFSNTGLTFDLALNDRNSVRAVAGAGVGLTLLNGITANLAYDGEFSDESTAHAVSGGFQIVW